MVSSLVAVNLVNWDGGVNMLPLDSLFVDNWLNNLVYVVVNMLTNDGRMSLSRVSGSVSDGDVAEESGELC